MISAATLGFLHSLGPAHWMPIVLVGRAQKWKWHQWLLGIGVASLGHIIVSLSVGVGVLAVGTAVFEVWDTRVERFSGFVLIFLGLLYALSSYKQHRSCHGGHEHHGPKYIHRQDGKRPYAFLFFMGFSPCFAVMPIFASVGPLGAMTVFMTGLSFSLGVIFAILIAAALAARGTRFLDQPWLEHHGDTLAGIGITLLGIYVLFFSVHHH